MRDGRRLIRAASKIAYDSIRQQKKSRKENKEDLEPVVTSVYITLEYGVFLKHLEQRNGQREEFQTTISKPQLSRKSLIRVFRLKCLGWSLFKIGPGDELTRLPKLLQILDERADFMLVTNATKQKRPNGPETSGSVNTSSGQTKRQ
jgi:hypothetical protein